MLRSCSKCGRVHDINFKCKAGRSPQADERALRSLNKWTRKSEDIRERSLHLCAICKDLGDYTPKKIEVHHIRKLKDYPQGLTEDANLIALCVEHHKRADRGEIDADRLRQLANERDGVRGYDDGYPPEGYEV